MLNKAECAKVVTLYEQVCTAHATLSREDFILWCDYNLKMKRDYVQIDEMPE